MKHTKISLLFIYPGYRDGVGIGEGLHGMSATGQTIESLRFFCQILMLHPGRLTAGTYKSPMKRKEHDLNQTSMRTCSMFIFRGVSNLDDGSSQDLEDTG